MQPFFGPAREETLKLLRADDAAEGLPVILGDGEPSHVIEIQDGRWVIVPIENESLPAPDPDESQAWDPELLEKGPPIYGSPSKAEFIRWLETWTWLGTGVSRAAPPSSDVVTAVELEFENLINGDLTTFSWTGSPDETELETLHLTVQRESSTTDESVEIPAHIWAEFIDALRAHVADMERDAEQTRPNLIVSQRLLRQVEGVEDEPAAQTIDGYSVDHSKFLSCHIRLAVAGQGRASCELGKDDARELHQFVRGFVGEFGLDLD